jgi:carboxypeptidase C (cathepsin A)
VVKLGTLARGCANVPFVLPFEQHYWLQYSERDPTNDPVVLWLNGGPGASGIIGMLTELGQLQTIPSPGSTCQSGEATSVPQLYHATWGWTKVANLLTIEQPKGVGFSYCTGSGPCRNDDTTTAQDTYEALVHFFAAYPEFKNSPFYVTGESCARPRLHHSGSTRVAR